MTKKARPNNFRNLVKAINRGQVIDGRTNIAKSIKQCRKAIQDSLPDAAKALLEHDASTAAVVQALALKQAFKDPNQVINTEGKAHFALNTWSKYAQLKRSSLLALKKFQQAEPKEEPPRNLGDLILETSDTEIDTGTEDLGTQAEDTGTEARDPHTEAQPDDTEAGVEAEPSEPSTEPTNKAQWQAGLRHEGTWP